MGTISKAVTYVATAASVVCMAIEPLFFILPNELPW